MVRASLVAQMVKHLATMQESWVQSLDWEDPLKGMLTTTLQNRQQDTHITDGKSEAWKGLVSCQGHTACAAWGCHSNSDCSSFKACVFHWKDCQVKVSRSLPSCFYPCVNLRIISFHLRVIFTKWLYLFSIYVASPFKVIIRSERTECILWLFLSQVSYTELMINKYLLCDSSSFLGTSSKISSRRSKNSSFLLRNGNSLLQVSTGDEWFLVRPLILDTMRSSCFDKTLELYCHSCQLLSLQDLTVVPVGGWGWACDSNASASLFSWATGKACSHYDKEDSSAKKEIPPGSQATNNGVCVCVCACAHAYMCVHTGDGGEISSSYTTNLRDQCFQEYLGMSFKMRKSPTLSWEGPWNSLHFIPL